MTITECHAERPGPYPVLCREPNRHKGDHCGSYGGFRYTWERATVPTRRIVIEFPARVLDETTDDDLFDKVADAAHDWESRIPARDWDVNVYATVIDLEEL